MTPECHGFLIIVPFQLISSHHVVSQPATWSNLSPSLFSAPPASICCLLLQESESAWSGTLGMSEQPMWHLWWHIRQSYVARFTGTWMCEGPAKSTQLLPVLHPPLPQHP